MADPDYVQLPTDAADNKNKIRSFSVVDDEGNTVLQQVSVLADADGNLLTVSGDGRPRLLVKAPHNNEILEEQSRILKQIRELLVMTLRPKGSGQVLLDDSFTEELR
jgi:hypothetical protein